MEDREQLTGETGILDPHATQHGGTGATTESVTTDGPGEEGDEFDAGCLDANDSFDEHMETSPMHKDGLVYDEPPHTDFDKKGDSGFPNIEKAVKIPGSEKKSKKPPPIPARIHLSDGEKIHSGTSDMSAQQAGSFKHQYYVIKAMKARQCAPTALGGVGCFARGQMEGRPSSDVGFDLEGDCRKFRAQHFHDVANGKNVSISFEFNGFDCLACEPTHSIRGRLDSGEPIAIFLSDQSFPPVLPASDSNCAVVVRVETF
jgi:hypothetical protein